MMIKKKVFNSLIALAVGVIAGLLIKYLRHFSFNFEVSVFDVFQLIVTVFLAWWVAEKLEKDSTKERCEKDILIEKIKMMDEIVGKLRTTILTSDIVPLTAVNTLIGSFDEISHRVIETLNKNYTTLLSDSENDYQDKWEELDHLCSDDKLNPDSIVIEERDGISSCLYTANRVNDILADASEIQDKLFKLQLMINRA